VLQDHGSPRPNGDVKEESFGPRSSERPRSRSGSSSSRSTPSLKIKDVSFSYIELLLMSEVSYIF